MSFVRVYGQRFDENICSIVVTSERARHLPGFSFADRSPCFPSHAYVITYQHHREKTKASMSVAADRIKEGSIEAAEKIKDGSAHAAEATKRAAQRTKLNGDIELLKRKIRTLKQEFGVKVFPSMSIGDNGTVSQIFAEFNEKVEQLENEVQAKQSQIQALAAPGGHVPATASASSTHHVSGFASADQPSASTGGGGGDGGGLVV
jgi:hypothetical protein